MNHPALPRRIAATLALLLAVLFTCMSVVAEAPEPTGVPYDNTGKDRNHSTYIGLYYLNEGQIADDLFALKQRLYDYGYYGEVDMQSIGLLNRKLDDTTWLALERCCKANDMDDLSSQDGLTFGAWDRIRDDAIINLNAPAEATEAPSAYPDIPWGEGGDNLPAIIDSLVTMGYLDSRDHATYDQAVRDALQEFGQYNGYREYYDNDEEGSVRPIESDLQRVLLEVQTLVPRPAPTVDPDTKGLKGYFSRPVDVAGMHIPTFVLWIVGLVVLVGGALAALYFLTPSEARKGGKGAAKNTVRFSITYQGKTEETETQIVKSLKIGRGIGNFPLNMEDTMISRRHCELYYNNNALMLRDYSANGTTVNGKPVNNAECIVKSGDTIVIGNHTIVITF